MGEVTPKVKLFIFISTISLLINLSICGVAYAMDTNTTLTTGEGDTTLETEGGDIGIVGNVAIASSTSFLPFIDLINIGTLNLGDLPLLLVFYALITTVLGALKLFYLIVMAINVLPFFNV